MIAQGLVGMEVGTLAVDAFGALKSQQELRWSSAIEESMGVQTSLESLTLWEGPKEQSSTPRRLKVESAGPSPGETEWGIERQEPTAVLCFPLLPSLKQGTFPIGPSRRVDR